MKDTITRYMELHKAIQNTKSSVNEISLYAVKTVSLSSLKEELAGLVDNGVITGSQFDAIFSEATLRELRPYKGSLQGLTDNELGIVSKDYVSDIISYITGIRLPSASSGKAWANAEKFVKSLGFDAEMTDINKAIPATVFTANNYDRVIECCNSEKYHRLTIPVEIEGTPETVGMLEYECEKPSVALAREYAAKITDTDMEKGFVYSVSTTELIEAVLHKGSTSPDDLDLSSELSEYGKKNRLPVFSETDLFGVPDETCCEDYGEYLPQYS